MRCRHTGRDVRRQLLFVTLPESKFRLKEHQKRKVDFLQAIYGEAQQVGKTLGFHNPFIKRDSGF
jgi:hypothetical protein